MNAPYIWILFPLILGVILLVLHRNRALVVSLAAIFCLALSLIAALMPIGETFIIGKFTAEIGSTLNVLGRQFVLTNGDRTYLTLIYSLGAVWFLVGGITLAHHYFVPLGVAMIAVFVAAFAVEPFFYAALLVEIAVLLSIPILTPPGTSAKTGIPRYIIFQTLAMPFILMAGWLLGIGEANPSDLYFQNRAAIFLGLGFALWLAVFPFHSWMPLLAKEAHPLPVGFILSLLPTSVLLLALDFLNGFGWLRDTPQLYQVLLFAGTLMVVAGGLFAAVQKEISRILGFMVIFHIGYALIAIGVNSLSGLLAFVGSLLPALLSLIVFAIALSVLIHQEVGFSHQDLRGLLHRYPFVAIGILAAYASIGGLPLLVSFPVRQEILELLAEKSFIFSAWAAIGSIAFLLGGARILTTFVISEEPGWMILETIPQRVLLALGTIFLILFGVFPKTFLSAIQFILRSFPVLLR